MDVGGVIGRVAPKPGGGLIGREDDDENDGVEKELFDNRGGATDGVVVGGTPMGKDA